MSASVGHSETGMAKMEYGARAEEDYFENMLRVERASGFRSRYNEKHSMHDNEARAEKEGLGAISHLDGIGPTHQSISEYL